MAEQYDSLTKPLRSQLDNIYRSFIENEKVQKIYRQYMKRYPGLKKKDQRKYFKMSILESISTMEILEPKWYPFVSCYSDHDHHGAIQLLKLIKCGKHACVVEGVLEHRSKLGKVINKPVIVKWYQSVKRNITYEAEAYQKLKDMDCPVPWFSTCYRVWNSPVLVMEKLANLSPNDNEAVMGVHVVDQLRYLHTFAVHCDIKPQNIMKRRTEAGNEYLLIDFGGISRERLGDGFRRWVWSERWSSQPSHTKNQQVTPKADFIELGFTMQAVANWRKAKARVDGEYRTVFKGRVKKYMEYVMNEIEDGAHVKDKHYDALIRILSKT